MLSDTIVIIPIYNINNNLNDLVKKTLKLNPKYIILVDDFCPKNSLKKLRIKSKRIIKIYNKINLGVGGAFLEGIKLIKKKKLKSEFVVKIDSDSQHDPNDLLKLREKIINDDVDHVKGNRFVLENKYNNISFFRKLMISILTLGFKFSSGLWHISDPTNGMFISRSKTLNFLSKNNLQKRYLFESDLLFHLSKYKASVSEQSNTIIYFSNNDGMKYLDSFFKFFIYYLIFFYKRIFRDYFFPNIEAGSIFFMTFIISLFFTIPNLVNVLSNIKNDIYSSVSEINIMVLCTFLTFISFLVWILLDIYKNQHKRNKLFKIL